MFGNSLLAKRGNYAYIDLQSKGSRQMTLALSARIGRKEATLVEIDRSGARIRHSGALTLGGELQLSFKLGGEIFSAVSQVLACRVVGLGLGEGGTTLFESKLNFTDERTRELAERMMEEMVSQ